MASVSAAGRISTHILDVAHGHPAEDVEVWLSRVTPEGPVLLASAVTGPDGRPESPLLAAGAVEEGEYELTFAVGAYFESEGVDSEFLDIVPVRFRVSDADAAYHVPLLITPWSYSTYRGS
jgi:5-hydroxyisourate hydrolase